MEIEKPSRRKRTHPEEFKQAVIAACGEAGASVAVARRQPNPGALQTENLALDPDPMGITSL